MNPKEKEIERLTRDLLADGLPEPSPDLSLRIMDRIMQETPLAVSPQVQEVIPETSPGTAKSVVAKAPISSELPSYVVLGIFVVYMLLAVVVFAFVGQRQEVFGDMLSQIKEKLPYIMTVAAIGGSLIFYSTLDKILAIGK